MSDSFATLQVVACQAPLSMRFPRQGYWNGLLFPSPGDLPNPGDLPDLEMETAAPATSPALQAGS